MVVFEESSCIPVKNGFVREDMIVMGHKLFSGKSECILEKKIVFGQSGCIRAKLVVFGQTCCIRAKWLYSGKKVVFRKTG